MKIEISIPDDVLEYVTEKKIETFVLAAIREKVNRRKKRESLKSPDTKRLNDRARKFLDWYVEHYPRYHNGDKYVVHEKDLKHCQALAQLDGAELAKRVKRYWQRTDSFTAGHPLRRFDFNAHSDGEWEKVRQAENRRLAFDSKLHKPAAIPRSTATCPQCGVEGVNIQSHKCNPIADTTAKLITNLMVATQ